MQCNAFGLIHRLLTDEEIAKLPPERQYLESLAKDLAQKIEDHAEVDIQDEREELDVQKPRNPTRH